MPIGLVTIRAVVTALGEARLRLRPPVPNAGRRARSLALAAHPGENFGCACALTSLGISGTPRVTARDRPGVSLLGAPAPMDEMMAFRRQADDAAWPERAVTVPLRGI